MVARVAGILALYVLIFVMMQLTDALIYPVALSALNVAVRSRVYLWGGGGGVKGEGVVCVCYIRH